MFQSPAQTERRRHGNTSTPGVDVHSIEDHGVCVCGTKCMRASVNLGECLNMCLCECMYVRFATTTDSLEIGLTRCKCVKVNINKKVTWTIYLPGSTLSVGISTQHDAQANSSPQTVLVVLGQIFPELDRHKLPFFLHFARAIYLHNNLCRHL